jgi:MoxR-like ATPase
MGVKVPGRVQALIVSLYQKAEQENLHLSMRRVGEGVKLCQANALLAGNGEVKAEDLRLFEHILWNDPEEIEIAQKLTLDFAGTVGKQAARARTAYEENRKRLSDAQAKMPSDPNVEPDKEVVNDLTTVSAQLRALDEKIEKDLEQATEEGHDPSELESIQAEVRRSRQGVRETMGLDF